MSASRAARSCSDALVAADLGEDVDGGRHVGCAAVSRGRAARLGPAGPPGVHRAPVPAALYLAVLGAPAAPGAPAVPQPPPERVLQARRRAAVPRLARRARRRPHQRAVSTTPSTPTTTTAGGCSASSSSRTTPEILPRAARGRRGLAARARPRPHDRPDGLHDQRRVRRAHRGLRARADDQAALAPALLRGALRGGRAREGDGPADVGARHLRPREDPADRLQARRAGRARARHARSAR